MAKARKTQTWLPGIDILENALVRTSEVAASLTRDGIDSVLHVFGVVSERDLADIHHALSRIEKRLSRIETRRKRSHRANHAKHGDEASAREHGAVGSA
jgi:hypothetical protein